MRLLLAEDDKLLGDGICVTLTEAGYATDPEYADKINRIIDRYMNIDD